MLSVLLLLLLRRDCARGVTATVNCALLLGLY